MKQLFSIIFMMVMCANLMAQKYDWGKVEVQMRNRSYRSAMSDASKMLQRATKEGDYEQMLRATIYRIKIGAAYQEDYQDSALAMLKGLMPLLDERHKGICELLMAEFYAEYKDSKYQWAEETNEPTLDYKLWSKGRLNDSIKSLLMATINNKALDVKRCSTSEYDWLTVKREALWVTPTLYDLVVRRCISTGIEGLPGLKELKAFHAGDEARLRLHLEVELLNKREATAEELKGLIKQFKGLEGCDEVTTLYWKLATLAQNENALTEAVAWCDSALAISKKNYGGVLCANLKDEITAPRMELVKVKWDMSNHEEQMVVKSYNTKQLYFRLVKAPQNDQVVNLKEVLKKQPVLKEWSVKIADKGDYQEVGTEVKIPGMPQGRYYILVSNDAMMGKQAMTQYIDHNVCDVVFVICGRYTDEGYLLFRKTGEPVENQLVTIKYHKQNYTATTDKNGYFKCTINKDSYWGDLVFETVWKGVKYQAKSYLRYFSPEEPTQSYTSIYLNKPVYRPGEEVEWAVVTYAGSDVEKHTVQKDLIIEWRDANYKVIDTITAKTDEWGVAHGRFKVPTNGLNGWYNISAMTNNYVEAGTPVKVEAYKEPKFMVTLPQDPTSYNFGDKITVRGSAMSYSQVPIDGGKVDWRVVRKKRNIGWRWWWQENERTLLATGSTTTNQQGGFEIEFEANGEVDMNQLCEFVVEVDVVDRNGESHSANRSIIISRQNRVAMVEDLTANAITLNLTNLEGESIAGAMKVALYKMKLAPTPHLNPHYELKPKDPWADKILIKEWDVENKAGEKTILSVNLGSGNYKVEVRTNDALLEAKASKEFLIVLPNEKRAQTDDLIWCDINDTAEVGSVATLRIGSRFQKVQVHYLVMNESELLINDMVEVSNEIKEIKIPIEARYLGGINVSVASVLENHTMKKDLFVEVPYSHKKIEMRLETFRDKLTPGSKEQWTLKLSNKEWVKNKAEMANVMMTMYDEALHTFNTLAWNLEPWHRIGHMSAIELYGNGISRYAHINRSEHRYPKTPTLYSLLELMERSLDYELYSFASGAAPMNKRASGMVASKAMMNLAVEDVAIEEDSAPLLESTSTEIEVHPEVEVRSNLNTAAFFMPTLRSDNDGEISISFTMPEALTRWNIQGLAWTQDLKVGRLQKQVVTQKEIMVTPNVPRFMRQGDKMDFMVKVSNMSNTAQQLLVTLEMTNAENEKVLKELPSKEVMVEANASNVVSFTIDVPMDVNVATYKVIAKGEHGSDGEQGLIPVLTNRQLMTESLSMYMNGSGEKQYVMKNFVGTPHAMILEYTSNPIWYAIEALPYLEALKSPSYIYMANQLYTLGMGRWILNQYPEAEEAFKQWEKEEPEAFRSNLEKNEDIKQTLLDETPWLRQARNEHDQHRQVAQFFDKTRLATEWDELQQKLIMGQRNDGSWSWMPNGDYSSEYTTSYILKQVGLLKKNGIEICTELEACLEKALNFVDNKEKEYYNKYIKGKKVMFSETDINYLYMRSFWSNIRMNAGCKEMYDFYYNNALKNHNKYENLFTRGQLALVFYRKGDKKVAMEMGNSLRECALYSDEMGMYWRNIQNSWHWYERPIETQSLLIEVFDEILNDAHSVGKMQQWLLKQKQTTHWGNDVATTYAIEALLNHGRTTLTQPEVAITVGDKLITPHSQSSTGYITQHWGGDEINSSMKDITLKAADKKNISWGAMYYQYFEDLDKIPYSDMGIKLKKELYKVESDGTLSAIKQLKVGDKVRVRILIDCDRNLDYIEVKDQRASAFEPISTSSGWNWNKGLSYYADIHDASSSFFIDHLNKGKYMIEYTLNVNASGEYSNGVCCIQCMYAPEFRANSQGVRLTISALDN